jgi:hypothetical protein
LRGIDEQVAKAAKAVAGLAPVKRNRFIARRYRIVQIRAGQHILTAEDPLPPDLREILALIK